MVLPHMVGVSFFMQAGAFRFWMVLVLPVTLPTCSTYMHDRDLWLAQFYISHVRCQYVIKILHQVVVEKINKKLKQYISVSDFHGILDDEL